MASITCFLFSSLSPTSSQIDVVVSIDLPICYRTTHSSTAFTLQKDASVSLTSLSRVLVVLVVVVVVVLAVSVRIFRLQGWRERHAKRLAAGAKIRAQVGPPGETRFWGGKIWGLGPNWYSGPVLAAQHLGVSLVVVVVLIGGSPLRPALVSTRRRYCTDAFHR